MLKINELARLYLGIQGENGVRSITVDVSAWINLYPNGSVTVWHTRCGESIPSPTGAVYDSETRTVTWDITSVDTFVAGIGEAEFRLIENEVIKKTTKVMTGVSPSVTQSGTTLGSDWQSYINAVDSLRADAVVAQEAAEDAQEAAEEAQEAAEDAQEAAEDAQTAAETAQGKAEDAQTAAEAAAARAEHASKGMVPAGGTEGQRLAKKSSTDFDMEWKTDPYYTKPAGGIPASDLAEGVIPDPEDVIDDTAGAGDTDKTWSADKLTSDVLSAIHGVMFGNSFLVEGFWIASGGKWFVNNNTSFYVLPVVPGDTLDIKANDYASMYTFLKTYAPPIAGETPDYATGYSEFTTGSYRFSVSVPSDSHYMILGKQSSNYILPEWVRSKTYNYLLTNAENFNNNASNIIDISNFPTSGYVQTDGTVGTGGNWHITDYYPAEEINSIYVSLYQLPGTVAIAAFYDIDKQFVYAIDTVYGTSGNGIKSGLLSLTSVPATAKYVRFTANAATGQYAIINYKMSNIAIGGYSMAMEANDSKIDNNVKITSFNSNGYIQYADGTIDEGSQWVYSDYLYTKNVKSIKSKCYQYSTVALVAFYDKDKNFISAVNQYDGQTGTGEKEGTISTTQIPSNAVFMRFTSYASYTDKYVDVKYDYTAMMKEFVEKIPEIRSDIDNFDLYSKRLYGYPFSMAFIGDSLTDGQTYVAAQGTPNYAYKNKSNYPDAFCKLMGIDTSTVIAIPGGRPGDIWSSKKTELEAIENQFVIVWLGTNGGLTDTVSTDCAGDDVDNYADTNTGNYGKIIKTLVDNGNKVFLAQLCYTSVSTASNTVIADLAERFGCSVIELTADDISDLNADKYHTAYNGYVNSVHFNSVGYNHVAGMFFSKMMKLVYNAPEDFEIYMADT